MKRRKGKPSVEEFVDIVEDADDSVQPASDAPTWRVLIVDDEREVHSATLFALRDLIVAGRPLEFLHAYSSAEAREVVSAALGG